MLLFLSEKETEPKLERVFILVTHHRKLKIAASGASKITRKNMGQLTVPGRDFLIYTGMWSAKLKSFGLKLKTIQINSVI